MFEIIEECSIEQLNKRETYWKKHFIDSIGWENVLFCQLIDGNGGFQADTLNF